MKDSTLFWLKDLLLVYGFLKEIHAASVLPEGEVGAYFPTLARLGKDGFPGGLLEGWSPVS